MALTNIFREVAIANSEKQPGLVDYLLEEASILGFMPMQPTSSGLNHQFEVLLSADAAGFVNLDEPLPAVDSTTEVGQTSVGLLGAEIEVGEDKLKALGESPASYFANKLRPILKTTGNSVEYAMIYNYLRAKAIETRTNAEFTGSADHAISAGGSSSTNYSIVIVKWEPDQLYGLYNPSGFGQGMFFDMEPINGGSIYHTRASTQTTLGYGMRIKSQFGILTANPRNVSAIVNIDLSDAEADNWNLPSSYQIDDAIAAVRGAMGGNTMMFMHPKVKSALSKYKTDKLEIRSAETNMIYQFDAWDGIPILSSYNFLRGNEPLVSFS
jgi:hypothetical protein